MTLVKVCDHYNPCPSSDQIHVTKGSFHVKSTSSQKFVSEFTYILTKVAIIEHFCKRTKDLVNYMLIVSVMPYK